ncbi:permease [Rhodococcus sp. BP-252]|uniref:Permease n=1 Tax=Rhodococcoides kyotonense TaxID=398843 RepID=A0A177YP77_9NOCA|nr:MULTISPECIES: permease [Rhodococcus]MBY6411442.1 permease [Rhodococcus sp. BP-320]MBY6416101.1 permease [Rhodococcus sp. BP-321]MBY6420390.1 permease [Rhodococcus sp. BP-324]MBY6426308.1 permease [Rhodococcus sp. BP-323]MBY6431151.1 permease [Rhodococcus sp. BP-322]
MTVDGTSPDSTTSRRPGWVNKAIMIAIGVVALIIAYFALAAFVPRWWGIRMSQLADQSFGKGILWGLVFGLVCTLVPLLLFFVAWSVRGRRGGKVTAIVAALLAVVVAVPNLMTLSIVAGNGNAALAAAQNMNTGAPGFRGATAVGAVVAAVLFALLVFVIVRGRRRRARKRLDAAAPPPAV